MKDLTYKEFFENVNEMIGFTGGVKCPKMSTFNSLLCILRDVQLYNEMIEDGDGVYKNYAELIKEKRSIGFKMLEQKGYYDEKE